MNDPFAVLIPGTRTHYVGRFYIEVWGAQRSWVNGIELKAVS